jgi:hypothetical protein
MRRNDRVVYSFVALVVSVILSSGFAIWYSGYQNHKWCDTLSVLTQADPRHSAEPSTPLGVQNLQRDIATYDALHRLQGKFDCHK